MGIAILSRATYNTKDLCHENNILFDFFILSIGQKFIIKKIKISIYNGDNIKKLYAILISLFFVASVFGVASAMAETCELPSFASVQVGDTFTLRNTHEPCGDWKKYMDAESLGNGIYKFTAIRPGKVTFNCGSCGEGTVTVTIIPKEYPIFSFMKMLGFGKKK